MVEVWRRHWRLLTRYASPRTGPFSGWVRRRPRQCSITGILPRGAYMDIRSAPPGQSAARLRTRALHARRLAKKCSLPVRSPPTRVRASVGQRRIIWRIREWFANGAFQFQTTAASDVAGVLQDLATNLPLPLFLCSQKGDFLGAIAY